MPRKKERLSYKSREKAKKILVFLLTLTFLLAFLDVTPPSVSFEFFKNISIDDITSPVSSEITLDIHDINSPIAPFFPETVKQHAELIYIFAKKYNLNPNLIATIITLESCGHKDVISNAGAQGAFQVMPFHFQPGQDMLDLYTNGIAALDHFIYSLSVANGSLEGAFIGYNAGPAVIGAPISQLPSETKRYIDWSRLYYETQQPQSPTLERWKLAGGQALCDGRVNKSGLTSNIKR